MPTATTSAINQHKVKQLYLANCRAYSVKPKKNNFNNFVQLLEGDFSYWLKGNLKFFFEEMNR